ncbi:hypothetical protein C4J87_0173 [Pseudomonas sp. R1-43-08]|nr:hypothetical protein C4J87_0173 [Pseudomonas sp. R1-43-08]
MQARKWLQKAPSLRILYRQVAKPESPCGRPADYKSSA